MMVRSSTTTPSAANTHRDDIDGLRAVAVLSVLLFHAGIRRLSGGFVGVDIFFVISGFLITSILLRDLEQGRFSILRFYDRRVRRIIPALTFMALGTALVGFLILTPLVLQRMGGSLVATALFSSNIWFWKEADYFAAPASTVPLLHTWSLAVEEQFYIFWPFWLWLLSRRRLRPLFLPACLIVSFISFALSQYAATRSPTVAFYLLPSRGWEIALGAVLASPALPQLAPYRRSREVAALAGLLLIAYAVVFYDHGTPFPGLHALVPVLGTMLLIHSGGDAWTSRLLSTRPFVFVGLISYSLYLWHWPVLTLWRQWVGRELAPHEVITALVITAILAVVSWRYVERPFRRPRGGINVPDPFLSLRAAGVTIVLLVAVGATFFTTDGLPGRGPRSAALAELPARESHGPTNYCSKYDANTISFTACLSGPGDPTVALWGDSHAGHLATALSTQARRSNVTVLNLIHNGCPPGIGVSLTFGRGVKVPCQHVTDPSMDELRRYPRISTVIIASRWSQYLEDGLGGSEPGMRTYLTDKVSSALEPANSRRAMFASLDQAISLLEAMHMKVLIVAQVPEFGFDTSRCVAYARWRELPESRCFIPARRIHERFKASQAIIGQLVSRHPGVQVFDPLPLFCDTTVCRSVIGSELLYRDDDHLSLAGAEYVMSHMGIDRYLSRPVQ